MQNLELPSNALAALKNGNTIEAIQHVQALHKIGFLKSKELVEQFLLENPDVSDIMHSANICSKCQESKDFCECNAE